MLGDSFDIIGLNALGEVDELEETADTLEGNSLQKASFIFKKYQIPVFADDTGLEVESLGNEPGVLSARYAGEHKNSEDNMQLLLSRLANKKNRKARFKTVITFITDSGVRQFEGIVEGTITKQLQGKWGFGYDPIFKPTGYDVTFADMDLNEKNGISHRGKAFSKFINYLQTHEL